MGSIILKGGIIMSHIAPDSIVKLYAGVESGDGNRVVFSNRAQQEAYYNRRLIRTQGEVSYIRKGRGYVQISGNIENVINANFLSFTNPSFEGIKYYAEIIDHEYVSNEVVKFYFNVDYFQTFMFGVTYNPTEIVREHLSQSDWTKAVTNPYDTSIPGLATQESFTFNDSDYVRPTVSLSQDTGTMIPVCKYGSATYEAGLQPYLVMFVTSSEYYAEDHPDLSTWVNSFTVIKDNTTIPDTMSFANQVISQTRSIQNMPRPLGIYCMTANTAGHEKMKEGIDALTKAGLSSNILGIYSLTQFQLMQFVNDNNNSNPSEKMLTSVNVTTRTTGGSNPKLKRAPFSYIKAVSPSGAVKEYRYEDFQYPTAGTVKFFPFTSLGGVPSMDLVPINYKQIGQATLTGLNFGERLSHNTFPQAPYTTDAFLTWMSSQYQQAIVNTSTPNMIRRGVTMAASAIKLGASLGMSSAGMMQTDSNAQYAMSQATSAAQASNISNNAMFNIANQQHNQMMGGASGAGGLVNQFGSLADDMNVIQSMRGKSPIYDYGAEKSAYIADQYHAGNSVGYINTSTLRQHFELYFMKLNDGMAQLVDNYFNLYGYNSGRIGIPYLCQMLTGGESSPHWATVGGRPYTYVHTAGINVIANSMTTQKYIEAVFDNGCAFILGDGR